MDSKLKKMKIKKVEFITSSSSFQGTEEIASKPEYAFIGRSNVGKSSLINMLTNSSLAKISSNPGKTQLINHYLVNESWFLVDLPGYGYAATSKNNREMPADLKEGKWPKNHLARHPGPVITKSSKHNKLQ